MVPVAGWPPTTPFTAQITPVVATPSSSAKNCRLPPTPTVAVGGAIATAPMTRNGRGETADPRGVVTVMGPVVAADGTLVMIRVADACPTAAAAPLNATEFRPEGALNPLPRI